MAHPMVKNNRTTFPPLAPSSDAPSPSIPLTPEPAASLINQHTCLTTGAPSRLHWKPDSEASHCEYPGCATSFGLFDRRHHCRRCGDIYCAQHCSSYFKLDQDCRFHHDGIFSRGCDSCEAEYHSWVKITTEQQQQQHLSLKKRPSMPALHPQPTSTHTLQKQSPLNLSSFAKRHPGIMTQQPHALEGVTDVGKEDIVTPLTQQPYPSKHISILNKHNDKKADDTAFNPIPSVPTDWQWSTF